MIRYNIRFLSSMLVLYAFGIADVYAVSSVKMLGNNSARIGTNASVAKADNDVAPSTQRLGTIRSKTLNSVAPVAVERGTTPSVAAPSVAAGSASDTRLSLGKYIHSSIKPVAPVSSGAGVSSNDFIALSDQVRNLQDTKQDVMSAGDGVLIDENTISLDPDVVYTKEEVDAKVAGIFEGDVAEALAGKADKEDIPTKTSDLTNDSGFLTTHQDISGKADKATTLGGYGITDAYTKGEVDAKVAGVFEGDVAEALAAKADKEDIPTKTSELTNDSGFLTTHQDISGKANVADVYTKTQADSKFLTSHQDISGKANVADVYTKTQADSKFLTTHQDISGKADKATTLAGYGITDAYTKGEVDSKVADIVAGDMTEALEGKANVADVYTKTQADSKFLTSHQDISGKQDKISDLDTIRSGAAAGATAVQPSVLDSYATKAAVTSAITSAVSGIDIPTKTSDLTNDSGFLTSHQDISGKANVADVYTKTQADSKFLTTHQDISGKASTDLSNLSDTGKANVSAQGTYDASAEYAAGTVGAAIKSAATEAKITEKINALDATKSQTASASNGNLQLSVTETDGKITAISGKVTHPDISGLLSNPSVPMFSGDYLLKLNVSDSGAAVYSWADASDFAGGESGGSSGDCDPNWEDCD